PRARTENEASLPPGDLRFRDRPRPASRRLGQHLRQPGRLSGHSLNPLGRKTMQHQIVSRDEWLIARKAHLAREKEMTRLRDKLAAERREVPWVQGEKAYVFVTPRGELSLGDLVAGRSQLIVKHFMLAPGQKEGCVGCSFEVDHVEGALQHLQQHDVSYVAVARAPLPEIEAFKARMGWGFRWVSSFGSDF